MHKRLFYSLISVSMFSLISCGSSSSEQATSEKPAGTTAEELTEESIAQPASPFIGQLFDLELHVGWEAVDSSWTDRRMAWGDDYFNVTQPSDCANAMLEFESVVLWQAVDPTWANRREAWITEAESAKNQSALMDLLMEFENYILWESVDKDWQTHRDAWIAECEIIKAGQS